MKTDHAFFRSALAALALVLAACGGAKRPPVVAGQPGARATIPATHTPVQPVNEGPDFPPIEGGGPASGEPGIYGLESSPLADIHFDFDQSALTEEARAILGKHATWLQGHPGVRVAVEGHCDERGTVEYNLALGDQRAKAARDYLANLGVPAERLAAVSFGKERPLDPGHSEEAWARNRRAHFAVSQR